MFLFTFFLLTIFCWASWAQFPVPTFCNPPVDTNASAGPTVLNLELQIDYVIHFEDTLGNLDLLASLLVSWSNDCSWKLAMELFPGRNRHHENLPVYFPINFNHWRPPLVQINAAESSLLVEETAPNLPMQTYSSGRVEWWIYKVWDIKCLELKLAKFPFDQHKCYYTIFLWEETNLLVFGNATLTTEYTAVFDIDLFTYKLGKAERIVNSYPCANQTCYYEVIQFPIQITRKWYPYYSFNIFIPLLTQALLQLSAFIIPFENDERITYSVALFTAIMVSRSEIQSYIPKSSEIIYIVLGANLSLILSMSATIYFAVIYHVNTKQYLKYSQCNLIDKITSVFFLLFYVILFATTLGSISN